MRRRHRRGGRAVRGPDANAVLVPLSGTNPSHVVGASNFHRFRLLTMADGFKDPAPDGELPTSVATAEAEGRGHYAARRWRSAARSFRAAADAAQKAELPKAEEGARLRALHCADRIQEDGDALASARRVVVLRTQRRDSLGAARSRCDLGAIYGRVGNFGRALDQLGAAATAFARFGLKRRQAHALGSMGLVHLRRAEYGPALDVLERAEAMLAGTRNKAHKAYVLNVLGTVQQSLGDADRARTLYAQARALHGDVRTVDAADVLGNLGSVHFHLGEIDDALRCYEDARAIYEDARDHAGTAKALFSLGRVRKVQGGYRTALDIYRQALDLQDADSSDAVRTRCAMAETLLAMDRPDDALQQIDTALESVSSETARIVEVELLVVHALIWLRKKLPERAVQRIRRALDVLLEVTSGLADEHVVGLRDRRGWVFDAGLAVALRTGRVDLAVEFLEHGRAGALLEGLGGRGGHRGIPQDLLDAELGAGRRLAAAGRVYLAARAARKRKELSAADDEVRAARSAYRAVQQRLQREAKRVASVFHPVPDSLADIRGSLADGDVFVLYALLPFQAHALVITPKGARIVWLGNTSVLSEACEGLRAGSTDPADGEQAVLARAGRLRELVIDPLALPAGTKRLLVSPDGPLCYMPFPLLARERPALQVACLPSGTTLRLLGDEKKRTGRRVLAVGDPVYVIEHQGHSLKVYAEGVPLEALPATRDEVTAITGPKDQRLLGTYATVRSLTEVAATNARWSTIHLACHGLIDPRTPTLSALALTPEAGDDGFLTALEVFGMRLPADLVVLSGCNTGHGRYMKGEGLVGLMRAFMCAGAPRVVVSLWKVDDLATQALMTRFHALWREGRSSASQALRQAQAEIRAQPRWSHPRYWAAWVLWGLAD